LAIFAKSWGIFVFFNRKIVIFRAFSAKNQFSGIKYLQTFLLLKILIFYQK